VAGLIEKIRRVNNPLTIIALFAGLAEVAGTVAIGLLPSGLQATFIWFVMGFPVALVLLFFATLNFNAGVLYAPSDYRDEANFLSTLSSRQRLKQEIHAVTRQLEAAQREVEVQQAGAVATAQPKEQVRGVYSRLDTIREALSSVEESADEVTIGAVLSTMPLSDLQRRLLGYLAAQPQPASSMQIARGIGYSPSTTSRRLRELQRKGLVQVSTSGAETTYSLAHPVLKSFFGSDITPCA